MIETLKEKNELTQEIMAVLSNFHKIGHGQFSREQLWLLLCPLKKRYYKDLAFKYRFIVSKLSGDITGESALVDNKPR